MSEPEDKPKKRELEIGENLGCVLMLFVISVAYVIVALWGR